MSEIQDVDVDVDVDVDIDIERGELEYEEYDTSSDRSTRSSFESTQEFKTTPPTSKTRKTGKTRRDFESGNEEWKEVVENDTKHLMRKCRKRNKITSFLSNFFAFANDSTNIYMLLFSLATFIIGSIKEEYDIAEYITIGLSGIATVLQVAQVMFKFRKRSLFYKQASIYYKKIYRKLNKYYYTTNTDQMAEYLSIAYHDFDKLNMDEHKANFNKFKSYTTRTR